jgi:hypothetical protein
MMLGQQLPPSRVPEFGCSRRGPDDVREQDGRQHAVRLGCLPQGHFLRERDRLGEDLPHDSGLGNVPVAVQFRKHRPRNVIGQVAHLLDPDQGVIVLPQHQRRSADSTQQPGDFLELGQHR